MAPISLALWRSVEAKHFGSVAMEQPILDLGCGFGEFGSAFFEAPVAYGLDISRRDLSLVEPGLYKGLVHADAHTMPFPDETFNTVMSVSVLEHIPDVRPVFEEIARVLKPGGRVVISMPLKDLDSYMVYPPVLRRLGLGRLADSYIRSVHRSFKHVNLFEPEEWLALVSEAGLSIQIHRRMMSKPVTRLFDLGLPTATISQVMRLASGRRFVWRPSFANRMWRSILRPLVERDEEDGSNLFVVAAKAPP